MSFTIPPVFGIILFVIVLTLIHLYKAIKEKDKTALGDAIGLFVLLIIVTLIEMGSICQQIMPPDTANPLSQMTLSPFEWGIAIILGAIPGLIVLTKKEFLLSIIMFVVFSVSSYLFLSVGHIFER